jgi:hypothetical protein
MAEPLCKPIKSTWFELLEVICDGMTAFLPLCQNVRDIAVLEKTQRSAFFFDPLEHRQKIETFCHGIKLQTF